MLNEKALRHLTDFILRKAPQGLYSLRATCACPSSCLLDVKSVEDAVRILNDFFEKFGSLVEVYEIDLLKPWLKPYGIEIVKENDRYKAKIVKTGFEEKIDEALNYYCCGMIEQSVVLCRGIMVDFARKKDFKSFLELVECKADGKTAEVLKNLYGMTFEKLDEKDALFLIKVLKPTLELLD